MKLDLRLLWLAPFLLALPACISGGGGGGGGSGAQADSDWDSLVWDQGEWA